MKVKISSRARVTELIRQLYSIVDELESLFPGRRFTIDGHLVGSIGEVTAAQKYGLTLLPASSAAHDAIDGDGRKVQIKVTQGRQVALRYRPDHLLVLKLDKRGELTEIFNGPGGVVWRRCGPKQSNGQRSIALSSLETIYLSVVESDRIRNKRLRSARRVRIS